MILERYVFYIKKLNKYRITRPLAKPIYSVCHALLTFMYKFNIKRNIRHISGLGSFKSSKEKVVVCCLVRDGEEYIESFLDHYLITLGVEHIILLDNGSNDNTIELAKGNKRVSIYQTNLEFKKYNNILRRYMVERFSNGGWVLCVDIDEFYDFPHSDRITLSSFIDYLNAHSYTAVIAYLLDMIPNNGNIFSENEDRTFNRSDYEYYDLSEIYTEQYGKQIRLINNKISNNAIKACRGGIRKQLFNIAPNLLKHPLIFYDKKIKTFYGSHGIGNANVADVSSILFHYKFTPKFVEKADKAVKEKNYANKSTEYKSYLKKYNRDKDVRINQDSVKKLSSTEDLVNNHFLQVTNSYKNWVANKESKAHLNQN